MTKINPAFEIQKWVVWESTGNAETKPTKLYQAGYANASELREYTHECLPYAAHTDITTKQIDVHSS